MNSSGTAIQALSLSAMVRPAHDRRTFAGMLATCGVSGEPDHRCHNPGAGSVIMAARGSTGPARVAYPHQGDGDGHQGDRQAARPAPPITVRSISSIQAPTGRPRRTSELAATTTATPSSARAIPSRRWPIDVGARPTDRAVPRTPRGDHQPGCRAARPARHRRGHQGRIVGWRAGAASSWSALRAGCREPARDLLVLLRRNARRGSSEACGA